MGPPPSGNNGLSPPPRRCARPPARIKPATSRALTTARPRAGASNGTRTRDIQDHNLALYQLSYARHPAGRL